MTAPNAHRKASRTSVAAAVLVLAATFGITGCASENAPEAAPAPVGTDEVTAAPEDPTAGLVAGDVVPADVAEKINADPGMYVDRAYPMPDGTFVFVDGDAPAPAAVLEAAAKAVLAETGSALAGADSPETFNSGFAALSDALTPQWRATGKTLTYVGQISAGNPSAPGWIPIWVIDKAGPVGSYTSKQEAVAAAQAWVDEEPAKRGLIIVDNFAGTAG